MAQLPQTPPNTDVLQGLKGLKFAQAWWQWLTSIGLTVTGITTGLPFRGIQVFISSGTFIVPVGVSKVFVQVWGGGGGSGSTDAATADGSGAGGGGYAAKLYDVSTVSSVSVTVGGGGGGGPAGGVAGGNGGTSSFGTVSCGGGGFGPACVGGGGFAGGAQGTASGGDVNIPGANGGQNNYSNAGAVLTQGQGGTSFGSPNAAGAYGGGYFPGGGANGSIAANTAGQPGAAGLIIVRW